MAPRRWSVRLSLIGRWTRLNWDLWSKFIVSSRRGGPPTLFPARYPWIRYQIMSPATRGHNIWQSGYCRPLGIKRKAITVASISSLFLLHGTLTSSLTFFLNNLSVAQSLSPSHPPFSLSLSFCLSVGASSFRDLQRVAPFCLHDDGTTRYIVIVIVRSLSTFDS